jgi:hypothetical protein
VRSKKLGSIFGSETRLDLLRFNCDLSVFGHTRWDQEHQPPSSGLRHIIERPHGNQIRASAANRRRCFSIASDNTATLQRDGAFSRRMMEFSRSGALNFVPQVKD